MKKVLLVLESDLKHSKSQNAEEEGNHLDPSSMNNRSKNRSLGFRGNGDVRDSSGSGGDGCDNGYGGSHNTNGRYCCTHNGTDGNCRTNKTKKPHLLSLSNQVVRVIVIQKTLIEHAEKLRQVKAVLKEVL
ncbi:hypothetical protein YC2023_025084 [Brassica napus]